MQVTCSSCGYHIDGEHINVAKDTAYCPACETLSSLSELLDSDAPLAPTVADAQSEPGVTVDDRGDDWMIEASHRSRSALVLVPFSIFWAWGALSGIYGDQLATGEFDLSKSLIGLLFFAASVGLLIVAAMAAGGRTLLYVFDGKALLFIGVRTLGWYRRFDWKLVEGIAEQPRGQRGYLELLGARPMKFGWGLGRSKRGFVFNFVKSKIKK